MTADHGELSFLPLAVVLLIAAVAGVPIARRLGLSAVVAYIAAGVVIGPSGLSLFVTPGSILVVAELGIVLLLFLIGLELEFSRLLDMRRDIFGVGLAQLLLTALAIGGLIYGVGLTGLRGATLLGLALAMSATSIALQILDERGQLQQLYGQRAFAVLLFQDMAVVPLLALVPLLAPFGADHTGSLTDTLVSVARIIAAMAAVVLVGRFLLNPLFRLLAATGAREVMTAAALLVVLGAALTMQAAGMSMALGAFLAGVMLAESNYRHELAADIEPFRGLLLALFFMSIGMTIDMAVVRDNLLLILAAAAAVTVIKYVLVGVLFRVTCAENRDAVRAASLLTAAGEFAFVLLPLGRGLFIIDAAQASLFAAIAALTMLVGPPVASLTDAVLRRLAGNADRGADDFSDAHGAVLVIGFGRFGQIVTQCLLAQSIDVTLLDNDPEMIQSAGRFGTKVYYGDGTRLDVLRAAGAGSVQLIAVCVDRQDAANRIVDLVRAEFPGTQLYVRSFDRGHTLTLLAKGVDYEMRETFESALAFGRNALQALGHAADAARGVEAAVREWDMARLRLQQAGGLYAGLDMLRTRPRPEPLVLPERSARALNPEARTLLTGGDRDAEQAAPSSDTTPPA